MKNSIKTLSTIIAVVAIALLSFTFSSCNKDNDASQDVIYTCGFNKVNASNLNEMGVIENEFKSALGISESPFTKTGKVSECDTEVYNACNKAFNSLKDTKWIGVYSYQVRNIVTDKVVCTAVLSNEGCTISK